MPENEYFKHYDVIIMAWSDREHDQSIATGTFLYAAVTINFVEQSQGANQYTKMGGGRRRSVRTREMQVVTEWIALRENDGSHRICVVLVIVTR